SLSFIFFSSNYPSRKRNIQAIKSICYLSMKRSTKKEKKKKKKKIILPLSL
ncbi:hypothetical protein HMI55_003948, partial [Coelomomyces lativittatus]